MKKEMLKDLIASLAPGATICISYEDFSEAFPPGIPDQNAMREASLFAFNVNCDVKNEGESSEVCFTKKTSSPPRV